jgi:hypothetical protein
MTSTDYLTTAQELADPGVAHAYGPPQPDGSRVDLTARSGGIVATGGGGGAGGGSSSALDLLGLAQTLRANRLMNEAYTQLVSSGKYPLTAGDLSDQPRQNVMSGYGFEQRIVSGHRIVGHGGAAPVPGGIAVDLSIYADLDWVSVLLSNYYIDTIPYLQLADRLLTGAGARP